MKKMLLFFALVTIVTGCEPIEVIGEDVTPFIIEGSYDFSDKTHPSSPDDSLFFLEISSKNLEEIKELYETGSFLMKYENTPKEWNRDIRDLEESNFRPFSYKDSIIGEYLETDSTRSLHYVKHDGLTQICFKNLLIFECDWRALYQDNWKMMSRMYYFESSAYKNLFIINESQYDGPIFLEKLLFIEKGGILMRIELKPPITSYWISEVKDLGNGIIAIYSSDFSRSWPQNDYITLFSLKTKQHKMIVL